MKIFLCLAGVACAALMPASIASAKTTRLQTVDLLGMSTEGGEARLYWIWGPKRSFCRIEAIHLGEMGKTIYVFDFGARLFGAERREYDYNGHIFMTKDIKVVSVERTTLANPEGRKTLPKDFAEYKALFDPRHLAECSGK